MGAKLRRVLIWFVVFPVCAVSILCYCLRQHSLEQFDRKQQKEKAAHMLTLDETNAVYEQMAANAAKSDLAIWEMNHDWKTGNALVDAEAERTRSNSFFIDELAKIKSQTK